MRLLAADAVVYADGGGVARAFPRPVHGRDQAARLLVSISRRGLRELGVTGYRSTWINGQPGALMLARETGTALAVVTSTSPTGRSRRFVRSRTQTSFATSARRSPDPSRRRRPSDRPQR